ncbi:MAG TPA: membrane protein insertase YidC, partial [Coxiellaceae bacterium]|nr:membrane protein insertase YidC [Coxiellaceae bacterium]
SYAIKIENQISNRSGRTWVGSLYSQIKHKPVEQEHSFMQPRTYEGATLSSPAKRYQKLPYDKLEKATVNENIKDGWMAMQQHYFLTAWIPDPAQTNHYYTHVTSLGAGEYDKIYTIGFVAPETQLAPGASESISSTFYVGPESTKQLEPLAPGLDLTIDYGWLWIISKAIFWVMDHINSIVGNWGWSIILVTVLIKLLFYKLSEASYRSMARMRELQPRLATLRERYGDDKQKLSQSTMEIYKKEKINPLGGCLPVIVQIPVFIALYYVLFESVELRQAPFILWIHDLSVKDPYYVLPILMGLSMFAQQKLSPPPPDPTQAKVMMFLPVIFTVFFLSFPAGLVLYWLVNNCLSALQQWYIIKRMEAKHHSKK